MNQRPRAVRAVVTHGSTSLGALAPFAVDSPWWADVEPVTRHLDALLGTSATVLRIVDVIGGASPAGGLVTYHVELDALPLADPGWLPVDADEAATISAPHPARSSYARPGGPAADLRWADGALAALGRPRVGPATQVKTWNLSCVHRIPTAEAVTWLKVVNPWQSPEPVVLAAVAAVDASLVTPVLAADPTGQRTLVAHAPGEDCWAPDQDVVERAVDRWVGVQRVLSADAERGALVGAGVPNWSLDRMGERLVTSLVEPSNALPAEALARLLNLLDDLPDRLAALADAGLPDTLVHGDFQGYNWRSDGTDVTVMDWSDASISHPALDIVGLLGRLSPDRRAATLDRWAALWRDAVPGCDPYAAVALVEPLQPLQAGLLYQRFLDHIEPSERRYHEGDPAAMVALAYELVRGASS